MKMCSGKDAHKNSPEELATRVCKVRNDIHRRGEAILIELLSVRSGVDTLLCCRKPPELHGALNLLIKNAACVSV
jgi:hypothetical protein